jgi:hypothetical protein
MPTKLAMIYAYVSEEEKKAFEILAKMERRSLSTMMRSVIVDTVKNHGLLTEKVNSDGNIVQQVVTVEQDEVDESVQ